MLLLGPHSNETDEDTFKDLAPGYLQQRYKCKNSSAPTNCEWITSHGLHGSRGTSLLKEGMYASTAYSLGDMETLG